MYIFDLINFSSKIGHAIIKNGKVDMAHRTFHNLSCKGVGFSALNAEKIDRKKRLNVSDGLAGNPYTEWREVKIQKIL